MIKLIKNYITSAELLEITSILSQYENPFERHIVKIGMIVQCVCDLSDIKWESCNDLYDLISQSDIELYTEVKNINDIETLLDEEFGITNVVKSFLDGVIEKIDNITDINQEQLLSQVKGMMESGEKGI